MKTFEDICKMTQHEVKEYMKGYLCSKKYKPVDEDGFLYAKGTVPVLLVAHMDTVHKQQCKEMINRDGKLSSPQGIGGDDRCGIFIIMNLVKELNCSVLLCEDEEVGTVGAKKFTKTEYIKNLDVNYMIEFDRKNSNDAVFYSCDNKEFIDFVTDVTGFKQATGSFSDISVLMPEAKLSAVNLSCGYYNAHTTMEYVIYDEMMDTVEAAKVLIKEECEKPFEYIKKVWAPTTSYANFNNNHNRFHMPGYAAQYANEGDYFENLFDEPDDFSGRDLGEIAKNDKELELEVITYGNDYGEKALYATGGTKAECWMEMFLENPNLCFNDIVDYSWN